MLCAKSSQTGSSGDHSGARRGKVGTGRNTIARPNVQGVV